MLKKPIQKLKAQAGKAENPKKNATDKGTSSSSVSASSSSTPAAAAAPKSATASKPATAPKPATASAQQQYREVKPADPANTKSSLVGQLANRLQGTEMHKKGARLYKKGNTNEYTYAIIKKGNMIQAYGGAFLSSQKDINNFENALGDGSEPGDASNWNAGWQ